MSTQLLASPGKIHELVDDLESLWFVLLFESLHYVKHNNPEDINMEELFDQVTRQTGTHKGGMGKKILYLESPLITNTLEFDSKPFTTLVKEIYQLFRSLVGYYIAQRDKKTPSYSIKKDVEKLRSCAEIERLLRVALASKGWPKNESGDKVEDQCPPTGRPTPQQKETIALSYANHELVPSSPPSGGKRKREEEEDPLPSSEVKRPKVAPPLWGRIWSKCALLIGG